MTAPAAPADDTPTPEPTEPDTPTASSQVTAATARFLLTLLDSLSLSARDPELVPKAVQVQTARDELAALLTA